MSRLKTFGKYLLMFVAFYIFVTVVSIGFIKGTYETMEQNVYSSDEIQIEVDEAKSTFVNGYVKGKLIVIQIYIRNMLRLISCLRKVMWFWQNILI